MRKTERSNLNRVGVKADPPWREMKMDRVINILRDHLNNIPEEMLMLDWEIAELKQELEFAIETLTVKKNCLR